MRNGRLHAASHLADICVKQAYALDDTTSLARALTCKAGIATSKGNVDEAIDGHTAASAVLAHRGDPAASAFNKLNVASLLATRGDTMAARNLLEEAIPVAQGSAWRVLIGRGISSDVCRAEGDFENSQSLAMEALALARKHNYTRMEAHVRDMLAETALEFGYAGDASINIVLALVLYARICNMQYLIPAICRLGRVLFLRGECETAHGVFTWGLEWSRRAGMVGVQAGCLVGLAELQEAAGEHDYKAWEEALSMSERTSESRLANKCRYWLSVH
ncbi:hypothetical protein AURDEDRAFT_116253 [Auricularia subglabra TFB-10046 SS5]|nr:hypothetical protein AURDEDRAFT_116253 [Auricularia subglabra TFB-10046 SS5]